MVGDELPNVSIRKGREWHIERGHPWLFSGGVSQAPGKVAPGGLVRLLDYDGKFVATGYYNPNCDIAVRVLSREAEQKIDASFLAQRVASAWELRKAYFDINTTNVFRLINAEGDFLPGFIVDYYDGIPVVQSSTAGADGLLPQFIEALETVLKPKAIVVRKDSSVRVREGLETEAPSVVKGSLADELIVKENGHSFAVDLIHGQKTGYFTDQRDKRVALGHYTRMLESGARLLNCFSYTCSFSVYGVLANPEIISVNVDQSEKAIEQGKRNFELNWIDSSRHEFVVGDAFAFMDRQIARNERYEVVILDPPAFAKSNKDKEKALKGYARMTTLGMRLTKPGGYIVLCSCSGAVSMDDFLLCIKDSVANSGRMMQVVETFQHGADHPLNIMAPESAYLKVVFGRVLDS